MAIKLDVLAKQGILIGVLCIAELIFLLVDGLWDIIYFNQKPNYVYTAEQDYDAVDSNYGDETIYLKQLSYPAPKYFQLGCLICYVVGIFVSALMIFGILKKHKNLIIPWIVAYGLCGVAGVGFLIYSFIAVITTTTLFVRAVEVFTIACLALYPVVMLFKQMHREASEKNEQQCQIECQPADIGTHPKFNPYFVKTLEKEVATEL